MDKKKNSEECGMIVVETVTSFVCFIVLVFAVIYLINILIIHNKVQYAINSTAHELASYTYLYAAFHLREAELKIAKDGDQYTKPINEASQSSYDSYQKILKAGNSVEQAAGKTMETLSSLQDFGKDAIESGEDGPDLGTLSKQLEGLQKQAEDTENAIRGAAKDTAAAVDQTKDTINRVKGLLSDRESLIAGIAYMGLEAGEYWTKKAFAMGAAYLLTSSYLKQGEASADEVLKAYSVKEGYAGLDFSKSSIFCDPDFRMIDIIVEYDVQPPFLPMLVPDFKIHMVNRVTIPAWLDGDGVSVKLAE